ncbi:MAG TPA: nuclear transport factor 2 family protein [Rhodothermales bacterium]|nr:nuclear transport factor 2 family protein [Rhodothermales bacterium]
MKTTQSLLVIGFIAVSTFFVTISLAQEAQALEGSDEDVIRAVEDQERLAVLNRDLESLKRVWSEQLIVNAPGNRVSPNREVPLGMIQRGLIDYASFERRIEALRIYGDIAIVMGAETIEPQGAAPRAGETIQRRFTHVWKKDGEMWRLIGRHANIRPSE